MLDTHCLRDREMFQDESRNQLYEKEGDDWQDQVNEFQVGFKYW